MSRGDRVELSGVDRVAVAEVTDYEPISLDLVSFREKILPDHSLRIVQAITRNNKFDEMVRRVAEIGATEIVPVVSEHTVRRPNNPDKQLERWKRIAVDSVRVTGRDWLPDITSIQSFDDFVTSLHPDYINLVWGDEEGTSAIDYFDQQTDTSLTAVVGPEGGFTDEEKNQLDQRGQGVSLGRDNYRADTASMMISGLWTQIVGP